MTERRQKYSTPPAQSKDQQELQWLRKRVKQLEMELAGIKESTWSGTGFRTAITDIASWDEEMKVFALDRIGYELQQIAQTIGPDEPSAQLTYTGICTESWLQSTLKPAEQKAFLKDMLALGWDLTRQKKKIS